MVKMEKKYTKKEKRALNNAEACRNRLLICYSEAGIVYHAVEVSNPSIVRHATKEEGSNYFFIEATVFFKIPDGKTLYHGLVDFANEFKGYTNHIRYFDRSGRTGAEICFIFEAK
jgi:hypothetical protein